VFARPDPTARELLRRYAAFLPFTTFTPSLSMGEGGTPLVRARHVGDLVGLPRLDFKIEGLNPTGSFKDRGTIAGVERALSLGFRRVGTVSTGNMAASVAAYAARAGLPCTVLVSEDVPVEKLGAVSIHGPRLLRVAGDYGELYFESLRLGRETGTYFVNSDDPFRVEGQKTLGLELMEQCGDEPPDVVAVPCSAGGNAAAIVNGMTEWVAAGLGRQVPRLLVVQAAGCAPIASAFSRGETTPAPWPHVDTIAHAISNPSPPSGERVLRGLRGGERGWAVAVDDREIDAAQHLLAEEEGLFVQPDAAAAYAGVVAALKSKLLKPTMRVVTIMTGHGLKDPTAFDRSPAQPECVRLEDLARALG
jgi:threonine synthase